MKNAKIWGWVPASDGQQTGLKISEYLPLSRLHWVAEIDANASSELLELGVAWSRSSSN